MLAAKCLVRLYGSSPQLVPFAGLGTKKKHPCGAKFSTDEPYSTKPCAQGTFCFSPFPPFGRRCRSFFHFLLGLCITLTATFRPSCFPLWHIFPSIMSRIFCGDVFPEATFAHALAAFWSHLLPWKPHSVRRTPCSR